MRCPGSEEVHYAETRNVSASGMYFSTGCGELFPGQELECVMVLPEEITHLSMPVLIGCRGKVLRIEEDVLGPFVGVAMEISTYDFSFESEPDADQIRTLQGILGGSKAAGAAN
jgi:hypothetical protein